VKGSTKIEEDREVDLERHIHDAERDLIKLRGPIEEEGEERHFFGKRKTSGPL
jgi:hypothetical protein